MVNGHRIINWSGWYSVGGVELKYRRSKDNFKETIEIFGPTSEEVFVTVSLLLLKSFMSFAASSSNEKEKEILSIIDTKYKYIFQKGSDMFFPSLLLISRARKQTS